MVKRKYSVKINASTCIFCGDPMKGTGAPIWEEFCINEACTSKYIAEFEEQVRKSTQQDKTAAARRYI